MVFYFSAFFLIPKDLFMKELPSLSDLQPTGSLLGILGSVLLFLASRAIPLLIKNPSIIANWYAAIYGRKDTKLIHYFRGIQALYKPSFHGILDRNYTRDCIVIADFGEDKKLTNLEKHVDLIELNSTLDEIKKTGYLSYETITSNDELKKAFYSGTKKFFVVSLYAFAIYKREGLMNELNKEKIRSLYVVAFESEVILTDDEIKDISKKINSYTYNFSID